MGRYRLLACSLWRFSSSSTDWHDLASVSGQMQTMHYWLAVRLTSREVLELR